MNQFSTLFNQLRSDRIKQRKTIRKALAEGPATVETLSERTSMPPSHVLWNLMAMVRWADVEITEHEEKELEFRLKEVS
jgi:DNA-binding IclR family transcriptional regulator